MPAPPAETRAYRLGAPSVEAGALRHETQTKSADSHGQNEKRAIKEDHLLITRWQLIYLSRANADKIMLAKHYSIARCAVRLIAQGHPQRKNAKKPKKPLDIMPRRALYYAH